MIKAYGTKLILSEGKLGIKGAISLAEEMCKENPNAIFVGQFTNMSNPRAHELTTGPELVKQCEQFGVNPAYLVCCVGSGGTLSGVAKVMKPVFPQMKVVAIEPFDSQLLAG